MLNPYPNLAKFGDDRHIQESQGQLCLSFQANTFITLQGVSVWIGCGHRQTPECKPFTIGYEPSYPANPQSKALGRGGRYAAYSPQNSEIPMPCGLWDFGFRSWFMSWFRISSVTCRVPGSGYRVKGAGFRVPASGCRVQSSGFRVPSSGCRVQGVGLRAEA